MWAKGLLLLSSCYSIIVLRACGCYVLDGDSFGLVALLALESLILLVLFYGLSFLAEAVGVMCLLGVGVVLIDPRTLIVCCLGGYMYRALDILPCG